MTSRILAVKNISHKYKSGNVLVNALNDVSFQVNKGEIFGFLGPNGAGKTTTIKLILGILNIQKGEIELSGMSPRNSFSRSAIGYMPETANYYDYLTPKELLHMYSEICGVERSALNKRIEAVLELVEMPKSSNRPLRTFSKGMMQKVSFAQALINDPEILILDEPTGGLDPVARKNMRDIILDLRGKGKTIFFSSHELSEVELICDRIAILNKGELLVEGSVDSLLGQKGERESLENYFLHLLKER